MNFLPVYDIRKSLHSFANLVVALTHFLLWNVGIDYLSAAAYDDLAPAHFVFLESRVRNSCRTSC
jgi:hypothetical protein